MPECHRGRADPTRSSKRDERADDLTGTSEENKRKCLTEISTENRTICNGEEATGLLPISGNLYRDSNQGVWSELSEEIARVLSKSVVSLALMDGGTVLFACSGVAIDRQKHATRFLTSASLVKAFDVKRKDHNNLKVQVRHFKNVTTGFLGDYDLDHNIATVNTRNFTGIKCVVWCDPTEFPPHSKVASLGMDPSGKLLGTNGILKGVPNRYDWSGELTLSTFSEVCDGGPLFTFDGRFAGMNIFLSMKRTLFLQTLQPLMWLAYRRPIKLPPRLNSNRAYRDVRSKDQFGDLLESLGYPALPESASNEPDGMVLVNNFEDTFGNKYGEGVWTELSGTASSNIHENIVALASFNGEKRFFACTGFFIEWNGRAAILTSASLIRDPNDDAEILENLKIEVLRPNRQHAKGTLQHHNLHYNVALVCVEDFCSREPAVIQDRWYDNCKLLAVGCCFRSGTVMASTGYQFVGPCVFDCEYLAYTKCRITKAGIGGPLLTFDGAFVGMNFYDAMGGTPYLSCRVILAVLGNFKTESESAAQGGHDGKKSRALDWTMDDDDSCEPNSWPVPKPFWCHPDDLKKRKAEIWRNRPHLTNL